MGKYKTIVLGAVLVAMLLAGCGDQNAVLEQHAEAEAASSPGTTEVPAFHFESGTLELGDFDPQTLGDDLFDPCTEISEEEFAAAGITGVDYLAPGNAAQNGVVGCTMDVDLPGARRVIIMNPTDESGLSQDPGRTLVPNTSDTVPKAFNHFSDSLGPRECFAQVDTVRGGLVVAASILNNRHPDLDSCEYAMSSLESVYAAANA